MARRRPSFFLAFAQSMVKMDGAVVIGSKYEVFDQAAGHSLRLSAAHQ
jgi:hypothetical protein